MRNKIRIIKLKHVKCNLRMLMATHKISDITDLMNQSGLSRNSINKLYKETNMQTAKLDTLFKLCETFNCTLLIEYTPDFLCISTPLSDTISFVGKQKTPRI